MAIHPTAIVDRSSEIDTGAEVGAYAIIERGCRLASGVRIYPHAYISEGTTLDAGVQVHPFAVVGHMPQDVKYKNEPTYTHVGENTLIREHAQIHRGTAPGSTTVIGKDCFIMSSSHVGHNCVIADRVILVTLTALAGHVEVGEKAFIGGGSVVHQFCRIGKYAMVGGGCAIYMDVPPFLTCRVVHDIIGPNVIGLRRAGFSAEERQEIREVFRRVYRSGLPLHDALATVRDTVKTASGRELVEFMSVKSKRGILVTRTGRAGSMTSDPPVADD